MNSNLYNVSNENLLLVEFLNNMYNDNLRQISNYMNSINTLNESNSQIRSLFVQILSDQSRNSNNSNNNRIGRTLNYRTNNSGVNNSGVNNRFFWHRQLGITNNNTNNNTNNANNAFTQLYQSFFEPIEIYPTQMQIEAATRRVRYSDILSPKNRSCPIVMEDFNDNDMVTIIRHCGHIFNTDEINRWFTSNCRCPVCRYDIRNFNSNASSEYFNNGQSGSEIQSGSDRRDIRERRQPSGSSNIDEERINEENAIIDNLSDNLINVFINDYRGGDTSGNNSDISGNSIDDIYQNNSLIRILARYRNLHSG
jgi:hypothetical protein